MKIITWEELLALEGHVVWGYYLEDDFPDKVYIQYSGDFKSQGLSQCQRVCEEDFPILKPEYIDCLDYWSCLTKFNTLRTGRVSDLETNGDVTNREALDTKVVVYDKEDITKWNNKLESLNINY